MGGGVRRGSDFSVPRRRFCAVVDRAVGAAFAPSWTERSDPKPACFPHSRKMTDDKKRSSVLQLYQ
ncbi:hypothetical protein SBA3_4640007 [Candidatus Sulfopaludibacter sp. SbA3]|nr:hypothetical protein SBA3_4640007 [Candidatus Sulfopaludibacter sp. SbA3]